MKRSNIISYLLIIILLCADNVKLHGSSLCLGHVAVVNPIIALLSSATLTLSTIAHNAYQSYKQKQNFFSEDNTPNISLDIVLAERSYYEKRKNALCKLRNEFLAVKHGIEAIQGLHTMGSASFTLRFMKLHTYDLVKAKYDITSTQEKRLPDEQKRVLRKAREEELSLIEKHIRSIQLVLALHVNHLIDTVLKELEGYERALKDHKPLVVEWNNNLRSLTDDLALRAYKNHLLQEHLLRRVRKAVDEIKLIVAYYNVCTHACIKNTTTIVHALEGMSAIIDETSKLIVNEKSRLRKNIAIAEEYFGNRRISIVKLKKDIQSAFDDKQKEHEAQVIKGLEVELSNYSSAGGPKKDDEDENRIKISEKDKDHIFREAEGHFPKDTPEIRRILEDLVNDGANYQGMDKFGTRWFSKIIETGEQLWAKVSINNTIKNAGINKIPRCYNARTGLCHLK